jgi:DNA polymerase II small subunit/DNA polymerase delta subunit B
MNAVMPPPNQGVSEADDLIDTPYDISEFSITEDELAQLQKEFADHCEKLDHQLTEDEETRNYERFHSLLKEALESVGTFSEDKGDDDADFILPRDTDPSRTLRVVANAPVTLQVANVVMEAFEALGSEHAVLFTGRHGRCVLFSNGDLCREE